MKICGKRAGDMMRPGLRIKGKFIAGFLIFCFLISCGGSVRQQINASPVIQIKHWGDDWKRRDWTERLEPAPAELLRYILLQNKLDGFAEVPRTVAPSPEIAAVLKEIKSSFSPAVNKLLNERLVGIYSLTDLGGSGFAEEIIDAQSGKTYAVIVLDQNVLLSRKANDWASWKENSIFQPPKKGGYHLQMMIESPRKNTVQNAARYLLLHELGHVLGAVSKVHPSWTPSDQTFSLHYPFVQFSWKLDDQGKPKSLFDDEFRERKKIQFYAFEKAQLTNDQMADVYRQLQQSTNFVSMQAATSLWEDFAESFATYVHVVRDKRPWGVRVSDERGETYVFQSCWQENRCQTKKEFLEIWYDKPL
jgi:hypothetical protein